MLARFAWLQGGEAQLKGLLEDHYALTGSLKAKAILDDWEEAKGRFWQVVPASEEQNPVSCPLVIGDW